MLTAFEHIVSPVTAPWCGWTMLVLLILAVLSEWIQPGVISKAVASLTIHPERAYKDAPTQTVAQLFITVFRLGTLAMALCLCFPPESGFSFAAYMAVAGIILAVALVKMALDLWVDYTFRITRQYGEIYEHYSNLVTLVCVVVYVLLLIFLRIDSPPAMRWALGAVAACFLLLWFYRSARLFVRSPIAILYILLYMTTMELLPMASIAILSAKTISII